MLSTEVHKNGRWKVVDISELEGVYGKVSDPNERPKDSESDGTGQPELLIQSYENRIQDLQRQLELANGRENTLTGEKTKLLDMLSKEQDKTAHILTTSERRGWMRRLLGLGTG